MNNISLQIDEVDSLVRVCKWGKQCEPREGAVRIVAAEADTAALYGVRFNLFLCGRTRRRFRGSIAANFRGAPESAQPCQYSGRSNETSAPYLRFHRLDPPTGAAALSRYCPFTH
jgi:hypothetical protein